MDAHRARMLVWLTAIALVPVLASCDRTSSEPKPAPEVEVTPEEATRGVATSARRPSTFSSSQGGIAAGLDELLGGTPASTSSTPVSIATVTDSPTIADRPEPSEPDSIGIADKQTITDPTAIAAPDEVDRNAGVPGASASTRTENAEVVAPSAPSAASAPSGPLELGGIDPIQVGDRVLVRTVADAWVVGKVVSVHVDGTYDVERDGVVLRELDATKLRKQR